MYSSRSGIISRGLMYWSRSIISVQGASAAEANSAARLRDVLAARNLNMPHCL